MSQTPQRPFVPQQTPPAPRESTRAVEFKLGRPFVHGVRPEKRAVPPRPAVKAAPVAQPVRTAPPPLPLVYDPPAPTPPSETEAVISPQRTESLAPIEQFLHTDSFVQDEIAGIAEYSYELPPVEHFMDAVPDDETSDTAEWGEADWRQFDWRSAAALGDAGDPEATNAWRETDWEKAPTPARDARDTAAKAIADALDGIARRIREGNLEVPSPGSVASPADIAATLAKLLGVER